MTLSGHIQNGKIVLDQEGPLPEGATVKIQIVVPLEATPSPSPDERLPTIAERMKDFIGCIDGLPEDAAVNHDHYLYGAPKVS